MARDNEHTGRFDKLRKYEDPAGAPSFESVVKRNEDRFQGQFSVVSEQVFDYPPKHLWKRIASDLEGRKRRVAYYWWSAAAGFFLVLAGTYFIMQYSPVLSDGDLMGESLEEINRDFSKSHKHLLDEKPSQENLSETNVNHTTPKGDDQQNSTPKKEIVVPLLKENESAFQSSDPVLAWTPSQDEGSDFKQMKGSSLVPANIAVDSVRLQLIEWGIFGEEMLPEKDEPNSPVLLANLGGGGLVSSASTDALATYETAADQSTFTTIQAITPANPNNVEKRPPLMVGADIRIPIGRRFYLNPGFRFSFQNNDNRYPDGELYLQERNIYFGIPIELMFELKKWEKTSVYGHLGHTQELLVRSTTKIIEQGFSTSTNPYSPQLGVTLGGSVNYKLYKGLGVSSFIGVSSYYLAPEQSFYFDRSIQPFLGISISYTL